MFYQCRDIGTNSWNVWTLHKTKQDDYGKLTASILLTFMIDIHPFQLQIQCEKQKTTS